MTIYAADSNGIIAIEAENGSVTQGAVGNWIHDEDPDNTTPGYSGSALLLALYATSNRNDSGLVQYEVYVPTSGDYQLLLRVDTGGGDNKWLWCDIDNDQTIFGSANSIGRLKYDASDSWHWSDGGGDNVATLSAGFHVLAIRTYSNVVHVDKVALVPVGSTSLIAGATSVGPDEVEYIADAGDVGVEVDDDGTIITPPVLLIPVNDTNYSAWLDDTSRDPYRIVIFEIDHSEGTIYIGSQPWMSDQHIAYDDFLVAEPYFESSLLDSGSVGDIEIAWPITETDLLHFEWRGHRARVYHGDTTWRKSQFREIAGATNDGMKLVADQSFQFDLISDAKRLDQTFYEGEGEEREESLESAMSWLMSQYQYSGTYRFSNINTTDFATVVKYSVDESTTLYSLVQLLATSVDAFPRVSQTGRLQIIKPEVDADPVYSLNGDNIIYDTLSLVSVVDAVSRVRVTYNNGEDSVTATTTARTGSLDEEVIIETLLSSEEDAQALADLEAGRYGERRFRWSMEVFRAADFIMEGDFVSITHPQLTTSGVVTSIGRSTLSYISNIEVFTS